MLTSETPGLLAKEWKAHADDIPGYYTRDPSGDTPSLVLSLEETRQGQLSISAISLRDLGRIIAGEIASGDAVQGKVVL